MAKRWGWEVPEEWAERRLSFYLDGKWLADDEAKISLLDEGFLHGAGVFEGLRIYSGKIFKLREHIDRLFRSARAVTYKVPLSKEQLADVCNEFVKRNGLTSGHMRIVLTGGIGYGLEGEGNTLAVLGVPLADTWAFVGVAAGITLATTPFRRMPPECLDPRIKSLNYLNSILTYLHAKAAGADQALVLDVRGFVAESSGANFCIVKDGVLRTPTKYFVLEGITRATLFDLAAREGIPAREEDLTLYDVYTAEEAFLCGTGAEVTPVLKVDGRVIGEGVPGPTTKRLRELYYEVTHS